MPGFVFERPQHVIGGPDRGEPAAVCGPGHTQHVVERRRPVVPHPGPDLHASSSGAAWQVDIDGGSAARLFESDIDRRIEIVMQDVLQRERIGAVERLWLNRPERENMLDDPLHHALAEAFRELAHDDTLGSGGIFPEANKQVSRDLTRGGPRAERDSRHRQPSARSGAL